jgi:UDP-N-acetylmuramate dehydrogenase
LIKDLVRKNISLRPYTTLRAGGPAEFFLECHSADQLIEGCRHALELGQNLTIIGSGSNVLPSDRGVPGLVLLNSASKISVARTGEVVAESGAWFQDVFLKAAQSGLAGLSFAVGIPGSIGGALVSNAGAYRSSVSDFVREVEIVDRDGCRWVGKDWMEFSYRDSVFRDRGFQAAISRVHLFLPHGDRQEIYEAARDFQRQRILKQPPSPSAGSFFKNVHNSDLAGHLPGLTQGMRESGVVPAGFLIEAAGLKGYRVGGAMLGHRHANFILNVNHATASEIRAVAEKAKEAVLAQFGASLHEEVLYLGDW